MKRKHGESSKSDKSSPKKRKHESPGSSSKKRKHRSPGSSTKKRKHTQSLGGTSSKQIEIAGTSKEFSRELFPDEATEQGETGEHEALTPAQALLKETISPGKSIVSKMACRKYTREENKLIYRATKSLPDSAGTNEIFLCLSQDEHVANSLLLAEHTRQSLRDKFRGLRKTLNERKKTK
ncbi:uncharacterized protein LOC114529566 [Dendronephthya gigantea]|uniref:uncharacterized protein LOC114529566 n=1 Tax=Dendronephthya gigantea TaxID=151771 RepID=UPI0010696B13|nr:uncharacterized protein LOC114529566 [Dendronephthya gigantea]